mgnify:CR=1 FL=1|tara:strand:- start:2620 stop:3087 length:468 start_codon:yes stop_codon:yes gene_type:complete
MSIWYTGTGYEIEYKDLIKVVENHTKAGGTVYIGTDSFLTKKHCVFATAICLHGGKLEGGRYFIQKNKPSAKKFKVLLSRIMAEVEKTIYFALKIHEDCPKANIELHLDIGASTAEGATAQYSDMLTGYAKSSGFSCKVKPDSWASSSIADKHSK